MACSGITTLVVHIPGCGTLTDLAPELLAIWIGLSAGSGRSASIRPINPRARNSRISVVAEKLRPSSTLRMVSTETPERSASSSWVRLRSRTFPAQSPLPPRPVLRRRSHPSKAHRVTPNQYLTTDCSLVQPSTGRILLVMHRVAVNIALPGL